MLAGAGVGPSLVAIGRLLARYDGLLNLFAVLPVLMQARLQPPAMPANVGAQLVASGSREQERAEQAEVESKPLQPVLPVPALLLLLLAECCMSSKLLSPSDKTVKSSVKRAISLGQNSGGGFFSGWATAMKAVDEAEIYEVMRFLLTSSALMGLIMVGTLKLHEHANLIEFSPIPSIKRAFRGLVDVGTRLRMWCVLGIIACFLLGNRSELSKVMKDAASVELLRACGRMIRGVAIAVAILWAPDEARSYPFLLWCSVQCSAAVARSTRIALHEGGVFRDAAPVEAAVLRGLAMEGMSVLLLLPFVFRNRRLLLSFLILSAPCIVILSGGLSAQVPWSIALPEAMRVLSSSTALLGAAMFLSNGFTGMFSAIFIMQMWVHMHNLHKLAI
eukprot:NODE_7484_length_1574_cov_14.906012.p1 GENE.NODE_7484_length_1574_cov_14.906012~~NODE_7484_length_1574_cov_14.906012.p1  ORF type:complete len:390 (+),score=95.20 NODE_7484_length_1574_cov_14.906012:122-1291(+)